MNENTALTKQASLPVARPEEPSVGQMLSAVIEKGVTGESVEAVTKLVELYEHMQDLNAEKDFAEAFIRLQQEIPKIKATKTVPNKDGSTRYTFAPLEDIDRQLRGLALQHGFSYSFSEGTSDQPGRITKVCVIQHKRGHKRSHPYTVRIGHGP